MAYRLRYQAFVDWVPAGIGPSGAPSGPGMPGGPAQTLGFFNTSSSTATSSTFTAPDITALLTAMATDLATQMGTTANLARIQAFASGGG